MKDDLLFVGRESLGIEGVFLSLMGMHINLSFIVSSLKITEWYTTGREGTWVAYYTSLQSFITNVFYLLAKQF